MQSTQDALAALRQENGTLRHEVQLLSEALVSQTRNRSLPKPVHEGASRSSNGFPYTSSSRPTRSCPTAASSQAMFLKIQQQQQQQQQPNNSHTTSESGKDGRLQPRGSQSVVDCSTIHTSGARSGQQAGIVDVAVKLGVLPLIHSNGQRSAKH